MHQEARTLANLRTYCKSFFLRFCRYNPSYLAFYQRLFNMIKHFVVGCFFKASLSRLVASRLSSSAKTLAKGSVSHYSSCSTSFFFLCLLVCFIKNLLALLCLCFHVEGNMLCMITKTKFM